MTKVEKCCAVRIQQRLHLGKGRSESFLHDATSKLRPKGRAGWVEAEGGKELSRQRKQHMQKS